MTKWTLPREPSRVYLVMNDLGVGGVYGVRDKAEARANYMGLKYEMEHWIESWEITTDD